MRYRFNFNYYNNTNEAIVHKIYGFRVITCEKLGVKVRVSPSIPVGRWVKTFKHVPMVERHPLFLGAFFLTGWRSAKIRKLLVKFLAQIRHFPAPIY